MTLEEAKNVICANVIYACEKAGFSLPTIIMVKDACDTVIALAEKADTPQTDAEIPKNVLRPDCTGCRFIGTYDTEFPCANCVRKNKDYYDSEYTEGGK